MKHLKIKIDKLDFDWVEVLKDLEFILNEKDRISIVWVNWAWKTTLLKILTWEITNYEWKIENIWNLTLGYLHQIYSDNEEKTVREELKDWFRNILKMEAELSVLENKMSIETENMDIIEKYSSMLEQYNNIWGYDYNNKIHNVAGWMWIFELLEKKLVEISWWQRTKVALAKILLESPDILFLDEPTNFIDISSVEWLENYLQNKWKWWIVVVSHDREFLDKTCLKTFELQPQRWLEIYHYKYSEYVKEREKLEKKKIENWEREQEYITKQEWLINRFRAWSRAWWAKSREKMINKIDRLEKPFIQKKPKFFFEALKDSPEKIFSLKEAFIGRKEPLFFIQDIILYSWQRVGIVWENGVWKSTLLKTIIWEIDILDWFISKWKNVHFLYYSQLHEELDKEKSIRENFIKHGLIYSDQHLTAILAHYLFENADIDKKVKLLSWGQTSKLLFAILGQKESNLLILDEPTNHLDYDTREALESCLLKYKGTILFISHDRYFVNKLASHIWFISEWELSVSYGNYEDYKYKLENNIDFSKFLFDEEAELNLVLEEKVWEKKAKRLKERFGNGK